MIDDHIPPDYDPLTRLKPSTVIALFNELSRARTKFPDPRGLSAALLEEVGEWADTPHRTTAQRDELLQIACVALRLYEEGDPIEDHDEIVKLKQATSLPEDNARHVLQIAVSPEAAAKSKPQEYARCRKSLLTSGHLHDHGCDRKI